MSVLQAPYAGVKDLLPEISKIASLEAALFNAIGNGSFDLDLNGWVTYKNANLAIPETGSGGTATVTIARTTVAGEVLIGSGSMKFTKDGSNRRGEGFSYNFSIPEKLKGKLCKVAFDYKVVSGLLADDDLRVFIYDITNSRLIYLTSDSVKGATAGTFGKFINNFQASSDSVSYRLIVHVANENTNAYAVTFDLIEVSEYEQIIEADNVKVGTVLAYTSDTIPFGYLLCNGQEVSQAQYGQLFGVIGTGYNTQTNPTTGSAWAAPTSGNFRVPDLRGLFLRGAGAYINGVAQTLGGYQADMMQGHRHTTSVTTDVSGSTYVTIGATFWYNSTTLTSSDPTTDGTNGTPRTGKETRPANRGVNYIIKAFNSSTVYSGEGSNRLIAVSATRTSTASVNANTNLDSWIISKDTSGSFNGTTFTVPLKGFYYVQCGVKSNTASYSAISIIKNGGIFVSSPYVVGNTGLFVSNISEYNVGDTIAFACSLTQGYSGSANENHMSITRLPDSVPLASREFVGFEAGGIPSGTLSASGISFNPPTISFDRFSSYNPTTGFITIQQSGIYDIGMYSEITGSISNTSYIFTGLLYSSGTEIKKQSSYDDYGTQFMSVNHNYKNIKLNAGDIVYIKIYTNISSPTYNTTSSGKWHSLYMRKVD